MTLIFACGSEPAPVPPAAPTAPTAPAADPELAELARIAKAVESGGAAEMMKAGYSIETWTAKMSEIAKDAGKSKEFLSLVGQ